ncbi:CRISPR-associated protein (Cas_Csd1) [mine drainage metagenome]|uniref:CRISPR-associated protein (Cas_Csd1) n=1 Tax=mine drainage metagenome TaxID=410659 RepID=A0A1J5S120_9ZZZZ
MTLLASLTKAYERMAERHEVPPFGYSNEKIGFVISLNADGSVANIGDLRRDEGKKRLAPLMVVPQPVKRTSGVAPNFLWDKSSYVLGVTTGDGKRLADEHAAFVQLHERVCGNSADPGLNAFLTFLRTWSPAHFADLGWPEEMKDQNIVFALENERLDGLYLHDRPEARRLWAALSTSGERSRAVCLISGEPAAIARLHPAIKGVWGGQTSGVSLVSYNKEAFESYGHIQGDNAPISESAAFAYTTVLNTFLESGSSHRIQLGDASTVFWADASSAPAAQLAEDMFQAMFEGIDEGKQAGAVGALLEQIRQGRPVRDFAPDLGEGVRFHVLGLAPNAARVSIRFWLDDDFGHLAEHYRQYQTETRIEPPPHDPHPPLWKYLLETAVLGKRENIPPTLAGDCMRAILTGNRYPATLLSNVLLRLRSDKEVSALRVALLKAVLIRNFGHKEAPVALDPDNTDKGYLLGRLFALYEQVQTTALGRNVNATIKDKFYGSASAQPRKVFHLLDRGSANHLSKIGKQAPGLRISLERQIGALMEMLAPSDDPFPAALSSQQQALFGLGYYHQRNEFFRPKAKDAADHKEDTP